MSKTQNPSLQGFLEGSFLPDELLSTLQSPVRISSSISPCYSSHATSSSILCMIVWAFWQFSGAKLSFAWEASLGLMLPPPIPPTSHSQANHNHSSELRTLGLYPQGHYDAQDPQGALLVMFLRYAIWFLAISLSGMYIPRGQEECVFVHICLHESGMWRTLNIHLLNRPLLQEVFPDFPRQFLSCLHISHHFLSCLTLFMNF